MGGKSEPWGKVITRIVILTAIYILLGNARSIEQNPFIDGAIIAINMVVPVIAGILFGKWTGGFVGLFGTAINAFSPAGNVFEFAAIIPHTIMGFTAGAIRDKIPRPLAGFAIVVGHMLNIAVFTFHDNLLLYAIPTKEFWFGLGYEIFVDMIAIIVVLSLYKLCFYKHREVTNATHN